MMKNRKKIAIAAIVVLMLVMAFALGRYQQTERQEPTHGTSSSQVDPSGSSLGEPSETDKPPVDVKPDDKVIKPSDIVSQLEEDPNNGNKPTGPEKPNNTTKPNKGTESKPNGSNEGTQNPGTVPEEPNVQEPVTKTDPVNGIDYVIPEGLTGIAGERLVTVYLRSTTHLVWVNPDEQLVKGKYCYQAKFTETSDKNEKIVTVSILVTERTDPVKGVDYKIPTTLRGYAGNKLSSISLKGSGLVWKNPDEKLVSGKHEYEALFVKTQTKNEVTVLLKVTVWTASSGNDDHGNGGGTTNPPVDPNPPVNPNPGDDDDEGNTSDDTQQGGEGSDSNGTTNPGTGDSGDGSGSGDTGDDDDEGNTSDDTQQGGGGSGGSGTNHPGVGDEPVKEDAVSPAFAPSTPSTIVDDGDDKAIKNPGV